jgi:hypothetical protein
MRFEEKLENQAGYPDLQQNAFLARRRRRRTTTPAAAATGNRTAKVTSTNENKQKETRRFPPFYATNPVAACVLESVKPTLLCHLLNTTARTWCWFCPFKKQKLLEVMQIFSPFIYYLFSLFPRYHLIFHPTFNSLKSWAFEFCSVLEHLHMCSVCDPKQ